MSPSTIFDAASGLDFQTLAESGELDWYQSYANKGDSPKKGILVGNWNTLEKDVKGKSLDSTLKRLGFEIEWHDQVSRCEDCNGCIPDDASYAFIGECSIYCAECIKDNHATEYLEGLEDNPHAACLPQIDPTEHGYAVVSEDHRNGWYGSNDSPVQILKAANETGRTRLLFRVTDANMFETRFSLYQYVGTDED
jgi:hypothetical protein